MDDLLHMFLNDVCSDSLKYVYAESPCTYVFLPVPLFHSMPDYFSAPPARSRPRKLCQYSSDLHEPLQLYLKDVCSNSLKLVCKFYSVVKRSRAHNDLLFFTVVDVVISTQMLICLIFPKIFLDRHSILIFSLA